MNKTPKYSMPAEWAPHEATWMAWPHDDEYWVGQLEKVRKEFGVFVSTIAKYERVELLVADEEIAQDARKRVSGNVRFHSIPYSDIWLRDSGPIFAFTEEGHLALTNWEFNGWGNKYRYKPDNEIPQAVASFLGVPIASTGIVMEGGSLEPNGIGDFLTTRQCLLSPERNPNLDEAGIKRYLESYLGAQNLIWLGDGLENDHTDGHIDTLSRFTDTNTIVTATCEDKDDPNHDVLEANLDILASARSINGNPYKIVRLPIPKNRLELEGERLACSYSNFYICNSAVIVPMYDDPNDQRALEILKPLFPNHTVIGLPSRYLVTGGGAFHCTTQQQPAGELWRGR